MTNSWPSKTILFLFHIFFLENCPEVPTNYNKFKYSIIHFFRKYQLRVKILRTKLTRQVVYKATIKTPHEMRAKSPHMWSKSIDCRWSPL